MKIITGGKASGKTTKLIKLAAESGSYIVSKGKERAEEIYDQAKSMGLDINLPITYHEFLKQHYYRSGVKEFLIDDADLFIQSLSPVPVRAMTVTTE